MNKIDETFTWQTIKEYVKSLPPENQELLPGVKWGNYMQLFTPAFWKLQYFLSNISHASTCHRLASSCVEEVVMCILGGYGIPSEIGIIAFNRLKEQRLIRRNVSYDEIHNVLSKPMAISYEKYIRYRFYNQKTKYIYSFLNRDDLDNIPQHNDIHLRNWLLTVDGIGLKTASWITRNWLKSDKVAIIDIHLMRAGKLTGFFQIISDEGYLELEKKYLAFCDALEVHASNMDAIIWGYMKKNTKLAQKVLYS
jgi:N-glycosylase/DNA lyase